MRRCQPSLATPSLPPAPLTIPRSTAVDIHLLAGGHRGSEACHLLPLRTCPPPRSPPLPKPSAPTAPATGSTMSKGGTTVWVDPLVEEARFGSPFLSRPFGARIQQHRVLSSSLDCTDTDLYDDDEGQNRSLKPPCITRLMLCRRPSASTHAPGTPHHLRCPPRAPTMTPTLIKNGILQSNRRQPYTLVKPLASPTRGSSLAERKVNLLVQFALCSVMRSSPTVRYYSPQGVDPELQHAAREFVADDGVEIDHESRTIHLTRIIKWYNVDFGQDRDILRWKESLSIDRYWSLLVLDGSLKMYIVM